MPRSRFSLATAVAAFYILASSALSGCGDSPPASGADTPIAAETGWIGAWSAAPYGPYPLGPVSQDNPTSIPVPPLVLTNNQADDQSFRMILHPTIGGSEIRVRFSNLEGDRPLVINPVSIAQSLNVTGLVLTPGTATAVPFNGSATVTIAPGAEAISDPVPFTFAYGDNLAISFHVVGVSGSITWHAISFGPNYVGLPSGGDTTSDPTGASFTQPTLGWFFLDGIDVRNTQSPGSIIAIGDSITDGAYTADNTRWTDWLSQRIQAANIPMGILNEGINSNTVTVAGSPPGDEYEGPPAVLRFDRDVLQRPSPRSVVIFEGTNDLSAGVSAADVFAGLRSMVVKAHAAGLCVVVGTIMPRGNSPIEPFSAADEMQREQLNSMLRAETDIEGIADFDSVMGDPLDPTEPFLPYYFADMLHPNSVGTMVMANAVPITALVPSMDGPCRKN